MKNFYTKYDGYKHKIVYIFGIKIKLKLSNKDLAKIQKQNNNHFILHKISGEIIEFPEIEGLKVVIQGENNKIELWEPINFKLNPNNQSSFKINGNNNVISIKQTKYAIKNLIVTMDHLKNNNKLLINENFSAESICVQFGCTQNNIIKIGKDCMIASNVNLMADDFHTIYDKNNPEKVINIPQKGIIIGDHVWITSNVTVLKDVEIPDNTIIANNSVVTKSFKKENTIIGGIPAKIIKEDINWDRKGVTDYISQLSNNANSDVCQI